MRDEAEKEPYQFHFTHTKNHWSDAGTTRQYVSVILVPYYHRVKEKNGWPLDYPCIWIIDCWSVHKSALFLDWLRETYSWIHVLFVPANCTGRMQPCDLSLQLAAKRALKDIGMLWITNLVIRLLEVYDEAAAEARPPIVIDLRTSVIKRKTPVFFLAAFKHLQKRPDNALQGWIQSRLLEAWSVTTFALAIEDDRRGELWPGTLTGADVELEDDTLLAGVGPEAPEVDQFKDPISDTDLAEAAANLENLRALALKQAELEEGDDIGAIDNPLVFHITADGFALNESGFERGDLPFSSELLNDSDSDDGDDNILTRYGDGIYQDAPEEEESADATPAGGAAGKKRRRGNADVPALKKPGKTAPTDEHRRLLGLNVGTYFTRLVVCNQFICML
jgi:hypothetical protein